MDPAEAALSNYLILSNIFSIMKWKDRSKLKQVCKLWQAVINEIETRNRIPSFYLNFIPNHGSNRDVHDEIIYCSIRDKVDWPVLFTIVVSNDDLEPVRIPTLYGHNCHKFEQRPCGVDNDDCEDSDNDWCGCQRNFSLVSVIHHIMGLSLDTPAVQISGSFKSTVTYIPVIEQTPEKVIGAGLVIPKIPGIKCHFLHHNVFYDDYSPDLKAEENELILVEKIKHIASEEQIKGAFVFWLWVQKFDEEGLQDKLIQYLQVLYCESQFSLAGGLTMMNGVTDNSHSELVPIAYPLMVFLFTAPKTDRKNEFNMYTLDICGSIVDEDFVKTKIQKFAENLPPIRESSGLLLHSTSWYKTFLNIQKESLQKWFPNTPIVGMDCDPISTEFLSAKQVDIKNLRAAYQKLSSVFVLFTW